jgi:hypothetical protein
MPIYNICGISVYSQHQNTGHIYQDYCPHYTNTQSYSHSLNDTIQAIQGFERLPRSQRWRAIEQWCYRNCVTQTDFFRIRAIWLKGWKDAIASISEASEVAA